MNPNLPHYAGLGGGPNLNLLNNMLMEAGFQATDQPIISRPAIVPQYTYPQVSHGQDVTMHQHALNLGQTQTTQANSDPVHVIVYQQEQARNNELQQQPISYKIPQLGTVVAQEQNFVVNDQGGQISRQEQNSSQTNASRALDSQTTARQVQSPAERRKDIVAQAMQEQKIFEENVPKSEPVVKQEPGVSSTDTTVSSATDTKPIVTATKSTPTTTTSTTQRRPYQRSSNYNRQQVMPRLTILEDEDDGLTCRLCLASYWYKAEIHEHLKSVHSISDPDKYDKEEKDKKMRRMREEQQRVMMAKKQREERERRMRGSKFGQGRGGSGRGTIKLTSPGARPTQSPGQRPSFQYRDGAFICDLCKESFSDGNDMVTHWKSHVKKQQADASRGGRGRPRGRGRGRPSFERRPDSSEEEEDSDSEDDSPRKGGRKKGKGKGGKGMPRWTAYLLWSTRKRREVVIDHPDWTFAQIAKWISDEWKKIEAVEKDELQKEAEEMNELGIRKLPRDEDGTIDPDKDTTDEDSDFEEGYRKKTKPIMLKIKKEKVEGEGEEDETSESDWEPEADIVPTEREQTRSGRQRKRPSFFQEFESQENNLDSILEQFEKEQAQEFGKPRQPKPEKPAGEKKPRKPRKRKEPDYAAQLAEELEEEVLRSGRKRKVRRVMTHFIEGSDEDDKLAGGASSDDDDFEPPPEEEIAKIEDNDDQIEEEEEELNSEELEDEEEESDDRLRYQDDMELPPKKRGRPKKLLTDEEIEEATKAAMGTKPVIEIVPVPKVPKENGEADGDEKSSEGGEAKEGAENGEGVTEGEVEAPVEGGEGTEAPQGEAGEEGADGELSESNTDDKSAKTSEQEGEGFKVKPPWVKETLSDSEGEEENEEAVDQPESALIDNTEAPKDGAEDSELTSLISDPTLASEETLPTDPFTAEPLETAEAMDSGEAENPLGGEEDGSTAEDINPVPLVESSEATPSGEAMELGGSEAGPPLSEEDILTGPAHNLDDSQFKPDIVDPNLDDIFK